MAHYRSEFLDACIEFRDNILNKVENRKEIWDEGPAQRMNVILVSDS